jgi:hypothetical protein
MKLFLNKRGDAEVVLAPLAPLIIVIGVFILLLIYISGVGQSSYFEREFLTRDIGLMVGALQAAPYNVQINYPSENGDKAKDLKINITKNYVEAYTYNLDPKIAPSKVSRFYLFPSIMPITELNAAPKVEKGGDGKDITYSYRLYFMKDITGIIPSMNNKNTPTEKGESYFNPIYTAIENWYQTPKVYIETIYDSDGKTEDRDIKGTDLLKSLCSFLDISGGEGIYSSEDIHSSDNCVYSREQSDEKKKARILNLEKADFVLIIYVNELKQDSTIIDIYPVGQTGDFAAKSLKLADISLGNLKAVNIVSSKKQLEGALKARALNIASGKPAILVEIGNLEKIKKDDLAKIESALYSSVKTYYTT